MTTSLTIATDGLLGGSGVSEYITTASVLVSVSGPASAMIGSDGLSVGAPSDAVTVKIEESTLISDLESDGLDVDLN